MVLHPARYIDATETVEFGEILLFVGADFLISVRHGAASALHEVRLQVEARPDLLRCGPGAMLHAIVDRVVDDYQPVIDGIEDDIEEVEAEVFSTPAQQSGRADLPAPRARSSSSTERRGPCSSRCASIASGRVPLIHEDVRAYFRDVYDHACARMRTSTTFNELLPGALRGQSRPGRRLRQNEDVRKISAWVAILAVPTMIAGIYGMNFDYMPELQRAAGLPRWCSS